jgi:hypothetical protein
VILERVTFARPRPPTAYHLDVQARWLAIRTLYLAMRNRERKA